MRSEYGENGLNLITARALGLLNIDQQTAPLITQGDGASIDNNQAGFEQNESDPPSRDGSSKIATDRVKRTPTSPSSANNGWLEAVRDFLLNIGR